MFSSTNTNQTTNDIKPIYKWSTSKDELLEYHPVVVDNNHLYLEPLKDVLLSDVFDIFRNASGGIVLIAKSNIVIASEQNISLISKSDINFVSGNAIHGGLGYISYNPDLHSGQAEIVKALI